MFGLKKKNRFSRKKEFYKRKTRRSQTIFLPQLEKPKKSRSFFISKIYWLIGFLVVAGIFYFLFYSSFFAIKKVIVANNIWVNEKEISDLARNSFQGRRFLIFPKKNIFIFKTSDAEVEILNAKPTVTKIYFKKEFSDILKLEVKEREIVVFWQQNNQVYYLGNDGVICGEAPLVEVESRKFPLIVNDQNQAVHLGEQVSLPRIINFVRKIDGNFQNKTGRKVSHYLLPSAYANEVHVKTDQGFWVYLTLDQGVEGQLDNLKMVLEKEIKTKDKKIEYIDLRVNNWVYYK